MEEFVPYYPQEVAHSLLSPTHATFACKRFCDWHRETCEHLERTGMEHPDIDREFPWGCVEDEHAGELGEWGVDDVPECPHCHGPGILVDLLVPAG